MPIGNFEEISRQAASNVRARTTADCAVLLDAHRIASNVLFELVIQGAREPDKDSGNHVSERISLTASLLQSVFITQDLIVSGYYWSAAAILRMHIETMARITELRTGIRRTENKPPNLGILPQTLRRSYGRLSQAVHTSGGDFLSSFTGSQSVDAAVAIPQYRAEWAGPLLTHHVLLACELIGEILLIHSELYAGPLSDPTDSIASILEILEQAGFLKDVSES